MSSTSFIIPGTYSWTAPADGTVSAVCGGGGYSGGVGSWAGNTSGGGGDSLNNGTNQSNTEEIRSGHGQVIITLL